MIFVPPYRVALCPLFVLAGALVLGGATAARSQTAKVGIGWELKPYHIQVLLSVDGPFGTEKRKEEWEKYLLDRTASQAGALWNLKVDEAPAELAARWRGGLAALHERPSETDEMQRWVQPPTADLPAKFDKVMLLRWSTSAAGHVLESREWDTYTGLWGPPVVRLSASVSGAFPAGMDALRAAFCPVARVQVSDDGTARLRVQGGAVLPRTDRFAALTTGSSWRVVQRTATAGWQASSVDVPWTYLVAEQVQGPTASAKVFSRYQKPLQSSLTPNQQWVALGISPLQAATTLHFKTPSGEPLAGLEVMSNLEGGSQLESLGRTNLRGQLEIPPATQALRVLLVKYGQAHLVQLPLVPGWPPTAEATLAADDQSLVAEGIAARLQQRLLEEAARRRILLSQFQVRMKAGKKEEAAKLLEELQKFDGVRQGLETLAKEERGRLAPQDMQATRYIDKLFADLQENLTKHLSTAAVQEAGNLLATAREAEYRPYNSTDGTFTSIVPGESTEEKRSVESALGQLEILTATSRLAAKELQFQVWSFPLPEPQRFGTNDDALNAARDELVKLIQASEPMETAITFDERPAREFTAETTGGAMRFRILYVPPRIYLLQVIGPKDQLTTPEVNQFFDGFKSLTPLLN